MKLPTVNDQAVETCIEAARSTEKLAIESQNDPNMALCLQLCLDASAVLWAASSFLVRGSPHVQNVCATAVAVCMDCADECARYPHELARRAAEMCRHAAEVCTIAGGLRAAAA